MSRIDTDLQKQYVKKFIDKAEAGRKAFADAYAEAKLGQSTPSDTAFMIWFAMHSSPVVPFGPAQGQPNPYYDPNWIIALPYIEGGKEMLNRFQKLSNPPQQPQPPDLMQLMGSV